MLQFLRFSFSYFVVLFVTTLVTKELLGGGVVTFTLSELLGSIFISVGLAPVGYSLSRIRFFRLGANQTLEGSFGLTVSDKTDTNFKPLYFAGFNNFEDARVYGKNNYPDKWIETYEISGL
jgi:hypothetical protein